MDGGISSYRCLQPQHLETSQSLLLVSSHSRLCPEDHLGFFPLSFYGRRLDIQSPARLFWNNKPIINPRNEKEKFCMAPAVRHRRRRDACGSAPCPQQRGSVPLLALALFISLQCHNRVARVGEVRRADLAWPGILALSSPGTWSSAGHLSTLSPFSPACPAEMIWMLTSQNCWEGGNKMIHVKHLMWCLALSKCLVNVNVYLKDNSPFSVLHFALNMS